MKKFKFSLETAHKVREIKEEKELTTLAQLREKVSATERLIEEIERTRVELMDRYISSLQTGTAAHAAELDLYSRHFAYLERKRVAAEKELKEIRIACSEQVAVLSDAARAAKVTGSLRDKQKAFHDKENAKSEQAALDEITGAKFARRRAAERDAYDVNKPNQQSGS